MAHGQNRGARVITGSLMESPGFPIVTVFLDFAQGKTMATFHGSPPADLEAASKPGDLDLPGYRLHSLKGNRRGMWSISITANWRITFRFETGDVYDVDLADYHS